MDQPKKEKSKVNRPDTPLADSPKPNYSDMITAKRGFSKDKPYTPTARDSSYYKQGFDMAVKGKTVPPAYDMKTRQGMSGYYEATKRGLNPKKK
jgi:hypothetical protein